MLLRHRKPEDWWTNNATIEDWFDEMVGQANIINRYAGISMEDMWGKFRTGGRYGKQLRNPIQEYASTSIDLSDFMFI